MTVHSIDDVGCPGTFPSVPVRVLGTHHLPTEDVRCLSGRAEVAGRQLLPRRRADDSGGRLPGVQATCTHPVAQPVLVELPESDSLAAVAYSFRVPARLVPGVREGTSDEGIIPTDGSKLALDVAGNSGADVLGM